MNHFLTASFCLILLFYCSLGQVCAQERINHAKFKALQLAKPSLTGENPMELREDWWKGSIAVGDAKLVQQYLYKGNTYQFWLALDQENVAVQVNLYDSDGGLIQIKPLELNQGKHVASIKFTPEATGLYFLRISLPKNAKRKSDWALIYAYQP